MKEQTTPLQLLKKYWGYQEFRGEQLNIIESVISGKDVFALMPTGGGKSICFQIPALIMEGVTLVICPLIALMLDQVNSLKEKGISAVSIHSGMTQTEVIDVLKMAENQTIKLLYISPERIDSNLFKEYLPYINLSILVVDECHCISQWGYDFRPAYLKIRTIKDYFPEVPIIGLTASATKAVQNDIIEKLNLRNPNIFISPFERKNLSYSVFKVESKINKLYEVLQKVQGSAIVYCKNRYQTKQVAELLQLQKINSDYYHAGLSQEERNKKQEYWMNNLTRVIVCTNAFGMGIDKPDVRVVIHFDCPDCLESYYQEAGRAGRDGLKAYAVLLYHSTDVKELDSLLEIKYPSIETIKQVYQNLADYLQIPIGIGKGSYYDFDLGSFTITFKIANPVATSILKTLEQEEHITFEEDLFVPSRMTFIVDKSVLYDLEKTYPSLELVANMALRLYSGVYEELVSINEKYLAKSCKISYEKVVADLIELDKRGIIQYLPKKETTQILFLNNRAPANSLTINTTAYLKRKKNFENKLHTMLDYIDESNLTCRTVYIGNYFDYTNLKECGICDACLKKKQKEITSNDFNEIKTLIYNNIPSNGILIKELITVCNIKKDLFWEVFEFLQSKKILLIDNHGKVTIIK